jgi:acylglycerol lipase
MKESRTDTFTGARGFSIFYRCWIPEGEAKAVVILVHGYADHSGRFGEFAAALTEAGYGVYAMDFRGHGNSDGTPGDIENFDLCAADILTLAGIVKRREEGKNVFLLGHSMGGSVACLFASRHQDLLSGLVLSSSLVHMSQDVPEILKKIARMTAALLPRLPVEDFEIEGLSRVHEEIEGYKKDPLTYTGKVRARMGAHLLSLEHLVPEWISGVSLPMLILHGGGDPIIDPKSSSQIYEAAASEDKTLKLFAELYHDVFHEPEKEEVMQTIIAWLDERLMQ